DALSQVAKALATEIRLDRLLPLVMEQATEVLEAERSSLFLYDEERDELWSIVAEGVGGVVLRFPADAGLAGAVAQTQEPINLPDAYADPRFNATFDRQTGFRTRAVLCQPVLDREGELLGVIQVLNKRYAEAFSAEDEALLEAFAAHAALALERAMLVEAYVDQQRMQEALRVAAEVQREMLPQRAPEACEGFELSADLYPASGVGGDLYDYFCVDEHRLGFAVGDVAGKGISAALLMASTHTLLRAYAQQHLPPAECFDLMSGLQRGKASMFVTMFYGVLDARTGRVDFCNAGHNPPYLLRARGGVEVLEQGANLPLSKIRRPYTPGALTLEPGDLLFLYTDGVVEAATHGRVLFGEERLERILTEAVDEPADEIVRRVLTAVEAFADGEPQHDDVTVLAIRYTG
ncbi:MAG: GAF domain-containing SpoIIE family protein phosphatase, partial [Rhodothermales bacterium]|nr:GAF domain-containing SpoIIE family protein phosphatase [Rhodothermales bacterium]